MCSVGMCADRVVVSSDAARLLGLHWHPPRKLNCIRATETVAKVQTPERTIPPSHPLEYITT